MCVILILTAVATLALGVAQTPAGSDEAAINALLDRFEAAIAEDDVQGVESCLYRQGYLQVYDYSHSGVDTATISNWTKNPNWFKSNKSVKLQERQFVVDRNIAYARIVEVSRHLDGGEAKYRSMFILVKDKGRWVISVTAGRQL
jgi:ketosteroid isomerase-like protein